ncbi:GNAT family N-acetyltransferase [uncultured Dokdonia sp.]|uniref:GNAT family N-acetyltransferase n=1 Tax=Dokdonia sp. R78006 TaxID=3093866 RepID=UPI002604BE6F|nr:GNAT family N-acetyltransferase [uncultured Dokdonia sp.]
MKTLQGTHCYLRALEPEDIDHVYRVENDEGLWSVGETLVPFSKYVLKEYLANSHHDIFDVRQLRLVICDSTSHSFVGLIDVFDFDPHNLRAGIGIVIAGEEHKRKGYATESINLLKNYCNTHLNLHQLYANIEEDNKASISLFEKAGFELIGIKKQWRRKRSLTTGKESYINELLYQHIF